MSEPFWEAGYSDPAAPSVFGPPFAEIGTVTVSGAQTVLVPWTGLAADSTYDWYVTATDETGTTSGPVHSFTTAAAIN